MHIKTTEITKKLKQWYKEASDMMVYNPNVALKLTDRIINNATTPEVSKYLVWGASLKGCCLRKLGHSDEALNILEEAQRLHQYHTPQDKNLLVSILNNKGNAYLKKGNHQLALNAFLKCLPIAKGKTLIGLHNNIGITYASIGNMSEAVKYWKKAEANTELDNDLFAKANIKSNILNYYVLTEKIERAKQKAEETIALMESHPEQRQRLTSIYINVFNNLGIFIENIKTLKKQKMS